MRVPVVVVGSRLDRDRPLRLARHSVVDVVCAAADDYWAGLAEWWDQPVTVVNVERDMQVDDRLVDELLSCPHPLCTHAYRIHEAHRPYYAHKRVGRWVDPGETVADFSGIGFAKFAPAVRVGLLAKADWPQLEMSVGAAVLKPWHVHWPEVEHYHRTSLRESRPIETSEPPA